MTQLRITNAVSDGSIALWEREADRALAVQPVLDVSFVVEKARSDAEKIVRELLQRGAIRVYRRDSCLHANSSFLQCFPPIERKEEIRACLSQLLAAGQITAYTISVIEEIGPEDADVSLKQPASEKGGAPS